VLAQRRMEGENELAAALALLEEVPVAGKAVSVDAGILKAAYAEAGSPLRALATLDPPVPVLHLYAQPDDPGYLAAQQSFAGAHPWFRVEKLQARSHFPMFEVPEAVAAAIEEFVA